MHHKAASATAVAILITTTAHANPPATLESGTPSDTSIRVADVDATKINFDIPGQPLSQALVKFSEQAALVVTASSDVLAGKTAPAINGTMPAEVALRQLLRGTGLKFVQGEAGDVTILKQGAATSSLSGSTRALDAGNLTLAQNTRANGAEAARNTSSFAEQNSAERAAEFSSKGIPEILVTGSRSLNMDISRTEDDPQPYVVLDQEQIQRSGATTVEQFLQQRLPMNSSVGSMGGAANGTAPPSTGINLRGLGVGQTLILLDGHRMGSPSLQGASSQGDIGGIPLAAIERIEILPSTASGIYGGSATGGVINIITRKDYKGGESRVTYDNTFSTDSAIRKMDFVFGHSFNEDRTNILLSASYSDANALAETDRGFIERGYARMRDRNPDYYQNSGNIPVGSTPNFASVDGSNLVLRSGVALNSPYASVPAGYAGVATDGGAALAATAGQHNWELPGGAMGSNRVLYSEPTLKSAGVVVRHRFSDELQVFADLSSSESSRRNVETFYRGVRFTLPEDSPFNPFDTAIQAVVPVETSAPNRSSTERNRAVVGVIRELPADWSMGLDYTWDRSQIDMFMPPVFWNLGGELSGGGVDILRDLQTFPLQTAGLPPFIQTSTETTMKDANLRFSGPLGSLPGGRPILSAALAHRDQSSPDEWYRMPEPGFTFLYPSRSTEVSSAYLEYRLPLFSANNARPGFQELDLQVAVRHEKYASSSGGRLTFGMQVPSPIPGITRARNEFSSTDPTIALRWKPVEDLAVRMSYGTGFLPPNLDQLVPFTYVGNGAFLSDPRRGNSGPGPFTVIYGGNPALGPEESKSWSVGLALTPSALPDLRLSVDYTRIEKSDNIGEIPGFEQGVIEREALFPGRVVRGPNLPGDPAGWAGPIIQVDTSPENLASLELDVWDVQLDYRLNFDTRGSVDLFAVGTWQPRYALQVIDGESLMNYTGLGANNPLEFKANAGLSWNLAAWRAGWNVNYFDGYQVNANLTAFDANAIANQGDGGRVPSQMYHDVFASYDFGLSTPGVLPSWSSGIQVQLGVRNLFNTRPPVDMAAQNFGQSYYSQFGSPRLASYYLTVTTKF